MSRGTTRARRSKASNRPSTFFIVAIIVGILLFLWGFIVMVSRPASKAPVTQTAIAGLVA